MLSGLQWRAAPRRGSSAAGQHVHLGNARQALRGLPRLPQVRRAGWSCIALALHRRWHGCCGATWARRISWCLLTPQMLASGACCGTCPWKHIVWRESRTSCCGSMNLRSKAHKHSPTTRHGLQWSVLQASWRQRRKTRRWLRMPRKKQPCDWRAVRKSIVAATGPAPQVNGLPRRAKIPCRCYSSSAALRCTRLDEKEWRQELNKINSQVDTLAFGTRQHTPHKN